MKKALSDISNISVSLKKNILNISYDRARSSFLDSVEIDLTTVPANANHMTNVKVKSFHYKNKVLLVEKIKGANETLVVFTNDNKVGYYKHDSERTHPLTKLIVVKSKVAYIRLTKRGIRLVYACIIENKWNIPIKASYITVGDDIKVAKDFPIYRTFPSKLRVIASGMFTDYLPMHSLLGESPSINEPVHVSLELEDGQMANHNLTRGSRFIKAPKWYYAPITQTRVRGYSVSIRRSTWGGLSLVRRQLEPVELTASFRFFESKLVSFLMYHLAHLKRSMSKKAVNIYFEKNANQAEEGTIDIFRKARTHSDTKNYFIINRTSEAYAALRGEPGVVGNFTLKSYWLLYRANNIISTEVPQHVNILRSGNKYARRAPYTQKFVFLQHGVTYMKAQDKNSSFIKNREGEPDYMVVGSLKERDVVVDMLNIEEERLLNVGLPIFDKITYGHITDKSPDIATIMLTWKPYEEHLQDFSRSTYYQTVIELYEMLKPLVGKENIRIVAHPKFAKLLGSTDIADAIWKGSVSEVLKQTKLLITDYSSVCYNVLYQGGATVFYQPDLARYEENNGNLIPSDDEYVGFRTFTHDDLAKVINGGVKDGKVNLKTLRTPQHVKNYQSINEYHDGKNIDRLYERLKDLSIL